MKILLIQIRKEEQMTNHEFDIIVRTSGLTKENVDRINVVVGDRLPFDEINTYNGVIIGGSGSFSVLDNTNFNEYLRDVARYCKKENIPFLGICYGFQISVQAFGGTVIYDLPNMEVGAFMAYRNLSSDNDPLIGNTPREFLVGCGRQDRAEIMPEGAINYMSTDRIPYYCFTFPGTNFYAVQFHPELWKKEDNLIRVSFYRKKYGLSDEAYEEQIKLFQDAPESAIILKNFINNVVKPNIQE